MSITLFISINVIENDYIYAIKPKVYIIKGYIILIKFKWNHIKELEKRYVAVETF